MIKLTAILITKDEEANLERCLQSISWVDELIVVDSGSIDNTVEIARKFKAKVFSPEWKGFGPTKQYALDQATGDWVLSIDADEEVSFTLKNEIRQLLENDPPHDGYEIPRKTQFLGHWILHSGWYPDYVLRLFRKQTGRFTPVLVHEEIIVDGSRSRLSNPLMHYSYPTLENYVRKLDQYSSLAAEEMFKRGRKFRYWQLVVKPALLFVKKLLFQKGWRDGWEGYMIARLSATSIFLRYAKLRSLEINSSDRK